MDISQKPYGVAWWFILLLFRRCGALYSVAQIFATNDNVMETIFLGAEDILTIGPNNPWKFHPNWSTHMRVYSEDATGNAPANVPHVSAVDK